MRRITVFCLLISLQTSLVYSQKTDTIYYDADWDKTTIPADYEYYRVYQTELINGVYSVKDYYLTGELQMFGQFLDSKHKGYTGEFIWYYQNGEKERQTTYVKNKFHGTYIEWFENGQMETHKEYNMGEEINESKYWFENGQLKSHYIFDTPSDEDSVYTYWENGHKRGAGIIWNSEVQYIKWDQAWNEEGTQIITNGNGFYIEDFDNCTFEGELVDGLKHGTWVKKDTLGNFKGELKFKKGEFKKGYITDNGYEDNFKSHFRGAEYKAGNKEFYQEFFERLIAIECESFPKGKFLIEFDIDEKGNVININVSGDGVEDCHREKITELVLSFTDWTPGIYGGEYFIAGYEIPIEFQSP